VESRGFLLHNLGLFILVILSSKKEFPSNWRGLTINSRGCILKEMKANHIILLFLLLLSCSHPPRPTSDEVAKRYSAAVELYKEGRVEEATGELEEVVRLYPNFAPAHNLLGEIYRRREDLLSRFKSEKELRKATRLEPLNPEYHLNLGLTLIKRGFQHSALKEFKRAFELDSLCFDALYQIGLIWEEEGLKVFDRGDFRKAQKAFESALKVDPTSPKAHYHLGLCYLELGQYREAEARLRRATELDSTFYQTHLLLGYLYHKTKREEEAAREFEEAFRWMMTAEEVVPYLSIRLIASKMEWEKYQKIPWSQRKEFLHRFWKERDPIPTTAINERQIEHYCRVTYANLHFSVPPKGLPGWRTKRGEVCIRYGEPTFQRWVMPDVLPKFGLIPPKWVWFYSDLPHPVALTFADNGLNGNYDLPYPEKNWSPKDYRESTGAVLASLTNTLPQYYSYDYGGELLKYICRVYQFRGEGRKTDVEIYLSIPHPELDFVRGKGLPAARVKKRIAVFDNLWKNLKSTAEEVKFRVPPTQTSNPNLMVVDRSTLSLPPGDCTLALNIKDLNSENLGIRKLPLKVRDFRGEGLLLSDLALVEKARPRERGDKFGRGELHLVPRFSSRYHRNQSPYLYYEIYNLKRAPFTNYRLSYAIILISPQRSGLSTVWNRLLSVIQGGRWESIVQSTLNQGRAENEVGYLEVDMSKARKGNYRLSLKVEDLHSGQTAEGWVDFTIVD